MNNIRVGHYEQDGGLVYVPVGFLPDWIRLIDKNSATTAAVVYEWFREMETHDTLDGWSFTDGSDAELAAAGGIAVYDTGAELPPIYVWTASTTTMTGKNTTGTATVTARTTTAHGTYISPTRDSAMDRDAIFECTTASGSTGSTEPTWPAVIGETVADGNNVWERVNVATERLGYQGFRVAAAIQNNGYEMYYIAIKADTVVDHGDVDGWTDGVEGA